MTHEPPRTAQPELVRAIGRWSMVALAVNSILGSGIFGLPSAVAGLVGTSSPLAVLIAGAGMAGVLARFARGAPPVCGTRGTLLFVRPPVGPVAGVQGGGVVVAHPPPAGGAPRGS